MSDFFDDVFMAYCGPRECKECPLSRETSKDCRDLFARKMKAWAAAQIDIKHLGFDGMACFLQREGKDIADVKADTSSEPICQPRQNGEDINVPAKLPKWVKVGMWVTRNDCFTVEQVTDIKEGEIAVGYAYDDEAEFYRVFKPVRFRPYYYEEAEKLLGKTMKYEPPYLQVRHEAALIHRVTRYECVEEVHFNTLPFSAWKEMNATIDGLPIGVPEVDKDAMKEVEE